MSADLTLPVLVDELALDDTVAADLTPDEAEVITSRIRQWVNDFPVEDVVRAFRGRIWVALAYDSWAEWCECELGGLKLPVPQRRELVSELAGEGMSNRAIADTIGVHHDTINEDMKASTGGNPPVGRKSLGKDGRERRHPKPSAPQDDANEIVDAEIVDAPVPAKPPKRKPITDAFWTATFDLGKAIERVEKLSDDDRFAKNKDQMARHTSDLVQARDALQRVIEKLN